MGFSLGGNVVLKLASEMGTSVLPLVRGVCAVSTPLDLAACARRIAQPDNRLYEERFVRRMRARLWATGRYEERDFAWRPYLYRWLSTAGAREHEEGAIAAGVIRPIGFRYTGSVR